MRASIWRRACLAAVLVCLLGGATAKAASTSPRIVGGTTVTDIRVYPFQVALYHPGAGSPAAGLTCGGSIHDATHVITAAHCVFDDTAGRVVPTSSLRVLAGTAHLRFANEAPYAATVQDVAVSAMSFHPAYDPSSDDYDAAVLTLATPLYDPATTPPLDGTTSIAPIPPITAAQANTFANPSLLSPVTVSGWGDVNAEPVNGQPHPTYPQDLRAVQTNLVPDSSCQAAYGNITPRMICAGAAGKDSCFGDSGGPLIAQTAAPAPPPPAADALVGIVSFGAGCAQAGFPGVYERVENPEIQAFVTSSPPQAPEPTASPALSGPPSPGQTLTCSSGGWTGPPTSYTYQFARNGIPVTRASPVDTYTVQAADAGTGIFCQVRAINGGGYGYADSNYVSVGAVAPTFSAPANTTAAADTASPTISVTSKSCRRGRCTINVRVVDPRPSSGLRQVRGTVSWKVRSTCRRSGRRVRCLKTTTRRASVKSIGGGHFLITTGRLARGTYTLSVVAVDQAGNKARRPTTVTLRVR